MTAILDIPAGEYHEDKVADVPTLSASTAHVLCSQSPLHAWTQHPRLNPDYQRQERTTFDVGNCAHALLLEGDDIAHVVDAPDWRTAAAKEQRDFARSVGKVPLLKSQWDEVSRMVDAIRDHLERHEADPPLFRDGKPEQAVTWEDDGVACRALIDWLHDDYTAIDDLKCTSRSAHPRAYSRALYQVGGDVQAWFHTHGVELVTGVRPVFRWVVVETYAPYALSVITPGEDVLTLAMKKALYARNLWRDCLAKDDWPGYPGEIARALLPAWEESAWLEQELAEAV